MATLLEKMQQGSQGTPTSGGSLLQRLQEAEQQGLVTKGTGPATEPTQEQGAKGLGGALVGFGKRIVDMPRQFAESGADIAKSFSGTKVGGAIQDVIGKAGVGLLGEERARQIGQAGTQAIERGTQEVEMLQPKGTAEKIGATAADIGSFIAPGGALGKTSQFSRLGKIAPIAGEFVTGTAIGTGLTGDVAKGAGAGAIDAATLALMPPALRAAAIAARRTGGAATRAGARAAGAAQDFASRSAQFVGDLMPAPVKGVGQSLQRGASNVGRAIREGAETAARRADMPDPIRNVSKVVDERFVTQMETAQPKVKQKLFEIVDAAKKQATGKVDDFNKVIGRKIVEPMEDVIKGRTRVGKQIKRVRESLSDLEVIDATDVYSDIVNEMQDFGVQFLPNGNVNLRRGRFTPSERKALQSVLNKLRPNEAGNVLRTPKRLDEVYREMRDLLSSAARTGKPMPKEFDTLLSRLRQSVSQKLGGQYQQLMEQYAQLSDIMERILKLLPGDVKPDDILAALAREDVDDVAKLMRTLGIEEDAANVFGRMISNASPGRYQRDLGAILEASNRFGKGSEFTLNEIQQLLEFNNVVEGVYDLQRSRSLAGRLKQQGAEATDIAIEQGRGGIISQALGAVRTAAKENKQQAFEEFIDYLRKNLEGVAPQ